MDAELLRLSMPYYVCAVAAFGSAAICAVAVYTQRRPVWTLFLAAGFLLVGLAFYLIAITAAPGGHVNRGDVGDLIRLFCLVGGTLWIAWLALFVRSMVRVERREAK
jgi:hypothetical protein